MSESRPTAIVGGGLAGLFTAAELKRRGREVIVLEDAAQPGGVARTISRDGYHLEPGAGTMMLPKPALSRLLEETGVEVIAAEPSASRRYVYTRGQMVEIPESPKVIFAPLVSPLAKARAALEPVMPSRPPDGEESLDAFMRRRFGNGMGEMMAWLAASGVFAGDPVRLSGVSAFPGIAALEAEAGSIVRGGLRRMKQRPKGTPRASSFHPKEGMTGLAEAVALYLGDSLRLSAAVSSVKPDGSGWRVEGAESIEVEQVVVTARPERAADLVGGDLAELLRQSVAAPVVVVGFGGTATEVPLPEGFGALIGPDAGMVTRGILFESSTAPSRTPTGHGFAKIIAGGRLNPELVDLSDDELVDRLLAEAKQVLGTTLSPSHVEIVRHRPGIPQYELGHRAWLDKIDAELDRLPGLHLTGWGYRGAGVANIAIDAVATANKLTPPT